MKKILVSLLILGCSFAIFATNNNFSAKFVPVSYQKASYSRTIDEGNQPDPSSGICSSKYGIGAEISNKKYLYKGFFTEGGISFYKYTYEEDQTTDLIFSFGVGYTYQISEIMRATVHIDYAVDDIEDVDTEHVVCEYIAGEKSSLKGGFELGFRFNDKFEATIGIDGMYVFSEDYVSKTGITTVTNCYKLIPSVGISVNY